MLASDCELYAIYLLEHAQRSRIGSDLLRELARALVERGFTSMDVWVLAQNPAKAFYEKRGAQYATMKEIEIAGVKLAEQCYVWPDLRRVASLP